MQLFLAGCEIQVTCHSIDKASSWKESNVSRNSVNKLYAFLLTGSEIHNTSLASSKFLAGREIQVTSHLPFFYSFLSRVSKLALIYYYFFLLGMKSKESVTCRLIVLLERLLVVRNWKLKIFFDQL